MSSTEMSIEQARAKLGDLVIAAMHGQTTTITRYGRPAARIVAIQEPDMIETTTYIARVHTTGPERGITIVSGVLEDGVWHEDSSPVAETSDLPDDWGQDPDDPEDIDIDAVEAELVRLGYQMADAGWRCSGGQWAARVEPLV